MKKLVWIVVGIFLASTAIRFIVREKNERMLKKYQEAFTPITDIGTFKETLSREFAPDKKYKEIILMFHGYGPSPDSFDSLYPAFREAKIPYYAPRVFGHGLEDTHLMEKINVKDWKRQALANYDFLSQFAEKITVIGFSNGGSIGCYVAQNRPVKNLILIAPTVKIKNGTTLNRILRLPLIGKWLEYTVPMISFDIAYGKGWEEIDPKYSDERSKKEFIYNYHVMNSFKALFDMQNSFDPEKMKGKGTNIHLLLMQHDGQVNNQEVKTVLMSIDPNIKIKEFDSKHTWMYSAVSGDIVKYVMECIQATK